MAVANTAGAVDAPTLRDRKAASSVTGTEPKNEDGENGSYDEYHIDPVKESKMMRKFDACYPPILGAPFDVADSGSSSMQLYPWDSYTSCPI